MKTKIRLLVLLLLGSLILNVPAVTRYVDLNSGNPNPPYTSWSTAATNINDAIDAASTNDLILVTNGNFQTGGRVVSGTMTNRVAITKPLIVSSVNGPAVTIIEGAFDPVTTAGDSAVRCVYLASGATLVGFTITNGATRQEYEEPSQCDGGGVYCESTNAFVTNCIISGNVAYVFGGGVYQGTIKSCVFYQNSASQGGGVADGHLVNCLIRDNFAGESGGAYRSVLINCTITRNSCSPFWMGVASGGVSECKCYNSIIYGNTHGGGYEPNDNYGLLNLFTHCCTSPLPPDGFNSEDDPLFLNTTNGNFHLSPGSPCIDLGNNSFAPPGDDFDGNIRIVNNHIDLGAFESPVAHVPTTLYVDVGSTNPIPPYTSWSTAATILQDAADVSRTGDEILVSPGVYKTGGRLVGQLTNRVVLVRAVRLRSVNGPALTIIEGFQMPGTSYSDSDIRCAYLGSGATLIGVTLTNGGTRRFNVEHPSEDGIAGGAYCETTNEIVTNCNIINNRAHGKAGGLYRGTANNSIISNNSSRRNGGAASSSVLNNCIVNSNSATYGGGAESSVWNNCVAIGNYGQYFGGAANGGALSNCLLINNSAESGGGTFNAILNNCTVAANTAFIAGGGVGSSVIRNCIVYANSSPADANFLSADASFCCTSPLPPNGVGNFTNAPLFVNLLDDNLRLQTNSPCIDAGSNAYVSSDVDLDGRQRISGGAVDIGAYEFQGAGMGEFIGWLQNFALPTDGSGDFTDVDGDSANNWHEWRADTVPTNSLSVLRMVNATNSPTGAIVTWLSVSSRNYWLERATNFGVASPFQIIATNIPGITGTKTFTDTSATNGGFYFYRVGVE